MSIYGREEIYNKKKRGKRNRCPDGQENETVNTPMDHLVKPTVRNSLGNLDSLSTPSLSTTIPIHGPDLYTRTHRDRLR